LTWQEDYSINSRCVSENAIADIGDLYKHNRKAFSIERDTVTIELGIDKDSKRKFETWQNLLPREMQFQSLSGRESYKFSINRLELEKRLGYKLGGFFQLRNR
jgi:hypothetical protein